jgi:hypothetical protein
MRTTIAIAAPFLANIAPVEHAIQPKMKMPSAFRGFMTIDKPENANRPTTKAV